MPTFTANNEQQVNRALNILFKNYLGVSTTSLDLFKSPAMETYATSATVMGRDRVWYNAPEKDVTSVDDSGAQVDNKIWQWIVSTTYAVGDIVYDGAGISDGDEVKCYRCTTGHASSGTLASDIGNWEEYTDLSFVYKMSLTESGTGGGEDAGGKFWHNITDVSSADFTGSSDRLFSRVIPYAYGNSETTPYNYELFADASVTPYVMGSPQYYVDPEAGTVWFPEGTDTTYPSSTLKISFFRYIGPLASDYDNKISAVPIPITEGGTGQNTQAEAFDAVSPDSTLGDILISNRPTDGSWKTLAGNTVAAKKFLVQTGNGSVSADPSWSQIAATDIPGVTMDGNTGVIQNITDAALNQDSTLNIHSQASTASQMATINIGTSMGGTTPEINIGNSSTDVFIDGNTVTITGVTTTQLSETVEIADNIIELNSNITTEAAEDCGIDVNRGTSGNVNQGIGQPQFFWDESDMNWHFTLINTDDVDTGDEFDVTCGQILISGQATPTAHTGGAVELDAMAKGAIFIGNTGGIWIST